MQFLCLELVKVTVEFHVHLLPFAFNIKDFFSLLQLDRLENVCCLTLCTWTLSSI